VPRQRRSKDDHRMLTPCCRLEMTEVIWQSRPLDMGLQMLTVDRFNSKPQTKLFSPSAGIGCDV